MKPTRDHVVVQLDRKEERRVGSIIVDERETHLVGTVIAVGPGRWHGRERVPMTVSVGDRVVLNRWGLTDVKEEERAPFDPKAHRKEHRSRVRRAEVEQAGRRVVVLQETEVLALLDG